MGTGGALPQFNAIQHLSIKPGRSNPSPHTRTRAPSRCSTTDEHQAAGSPSQ